MRANHSVPVVSPALRPISRVAFLVIPLTLGAVGQLMMVRLTERDLQAKRMATGGDTELGITPTEEAYLRHLDARVNYLTLECAKRLRKSDITLDRANQVVYAERIYDAYRGDRTLESEPVNYGNLEALFGFLDEKAAPYFLGKYQDVQDVGKPNKAALNLALYCGGEDVGSFLMSKLRETASTSNEGEFLRMAIGGLVPDMCSVRRVGIPSQLEEWALNSVSSADSLDRIAAAGILGNTNALQTRELLTRLLEADSDLRVRAAAAKSLGRLGDDGMVAYLSVQYAKLSELYPPSPDRATLSRAFVSAMEDIKLRSILR